MSSFNDGSSWGLVGGVDGVPRRGRSVTGGWVMAVTGVAPQSPLEFLAFQSFSDLWSQARERGLLAVAVDIPIGLPDRDVRSADGEARTLLKPRRTSSVFNAPPLCALKAESYKDALQSSRDRTGRGLSTQAHALCPKIEEVRNALEVEDLLPGACPQVAEVHPEVSFQEMAGEPMSLPKRLQAGVAERLDLLEEHFPNIVKAAVLTRVPGPPDPGLDDVLDAAAAAWTARRLVQDKARRLGGKEEDSTGYPMNIWV